MTEPVRWLDPESDASGDLRALLAAGPSAAPPLPRDARESGARFVAGLAPIGLAAPRPWWAKSAALTAGASVTGAAILALTLAGGHAPPRAPRHAPTATATPAQVTATPAPVVVAPPPTIVAPVSAPPSVAPVVVAPLRHEAPAPSVVEARDEARLEQARRLLERDPGAALTITRALSERGHHSPFAEEAEYLTVRALARLDRVDEARRAGARFLSKHPAGIYSAAVRRQMENLP
jgi:hypothetical protein